MKHKMTIVGLGPGDEEFITLGALKALENADRLILRTRRHGVATYLSGKGITYETLDDIYESSNDFDEVYKAMTHELISVLEHGDVVLGLPGNPLIGERLTYELLRDIDQSIYEIEVIPGISRADAFTASIKKVSTDGLKIAVAGDVKVERLDPYTPTVIIDINDNIQASELKIKLLEVYSPRLGVYLSKLDEKGRIQSEGILLHTLDHNREFDHTSCLYIPKLKLKDLTVYNLENLMEIMGILRSPDGCSWDYKQDHKTLKQNLIEETYEVLEAIDLNDMDKLVEELGDLLLQISFHTQIAIERGEFTILDVTTGICRKMILRHPHIFANVKVANADEVLTNWEAIKKKEKGLKTQTQVLKDIPSNLPALMRAYKIQQKAALVGFDWEKVEDAMEKLEEELRELKKVYTTDEVDEIREELGDVLFSIVNVCRFLGEQPELALTSTSEKFIDRFEYIEKNSDKPLEKMTLEEMDALWDQAKPLYHNKTMYSSNKKW